MHGNCTHMKRNTMPKHNWRRVSMTCLWVMHYWRKTAAISLAAVVVSHALVPNEVTCKIRAAKLPIINGKRCMVLNEGHFLWLWHFRREGGGCRRALVSLSVLMSIGTLLIHVVFVARSSKSKSATKYFEAPKFKVNVTLGGQWPIIIT